MNVTTQLLIGSTEIDRARNEICQILNMLHRAMPNELPDNPIRITAETSTWVYMRMQYGTSIDCDIHNCSGTFATRKVLNYIFRDMTLNHGDVMRVREELEVLVIGMFEKVPMIKTRLKPIIAAAARRGT